MQNDKGNRYSKTIIVAPVSKKMSKPPIPTHVIFSVESLSYVSMILCEQLRTIDKKRLGQWICTLLYLEECFLHIMICKYIKRYEKNQKKLG